MGQITGIHHICIKTSSEDESSKVKSFYCDLLGLPIVRTWDQGFMFDTGNGLVEVFTNADSQLPQGVIRHFAFSVKDVDSIVTKVSEAGYEIFLGPKDILLGNNNPLPARIAFCHGPLGEDVEFFEEK